MCALFSSSSRCLTHQLPVAVLRIAHTRGIFKRGDTAEFSFSARQTARPILFFRARNVGPDKPTTSRVSQLTARRYRCCARCAGAAPVNSSHQVLLVAGWSLACRGARWLHLCWRVRARQPTPLKTSEDRVERLDAGLGGLADSLHARGAAWGLGAGIVKHEVACSACSSMPGGRPRSDRKGSPFCAGKEGAKSVERVVKVLGPLLAPAGNAREPKPAALWLLACLCSACLRHGHGRELVNELASAGMAEHMLVAGRPARYGDAGDV